jgi:signal transduction histidine kinase
LDAEVETTVYRLVQEALTNVVRHANTRSARVAVEVDGGTVRIEVQDDGVGFDVQARRSGFGVEGMRERVYLAGGEFTIESGDSGTTVRVALSAPPGLRSAQALGAG